STQGSCVLTGTVTPDVTIFEAVLQNEVCNGPGNCIFRGLHIEPGLLAFASGTLSTPFYNGPDFMVAKMSFCATHPGTAVLHWLFTPPAPITRDTEITDKYSPTVSDLNCYDDYFINII